MLIGSRCSLLLKHMHTDRKIGTTHTRTHTYTVRYTAAIIKKHTLPSSSCVVLTSSTFVTLNNVTHRSPRWHSPHLKGYYVFLQDGGNMDPLWIMRRLRQSLANLHTYTHTHTLSDTNMLTHHHTCRHPRHRINITNPARKIISGPPGRIIVTFVAW